MNKKRWTRWAIGAALMSFIGAGLALGWAWWAYRQVPAWYRPQKVPQESLSRVRASVPNTYQHFSDLLVQGQPFEFVLAEQTINQWIAARADIWPKTKNALPAMLADPVVAFSNDRVILAARWDHQTWATILSAEVLISVKGDYVEVSLESAASGSLPLPLGRLIEFADRELARARAKNEGLSKQAQKLMGSSSSGDPPFELRRRMSFKNQFYWSNGKRYFRIVDLNSSDGQLRISVQPL